MNKTIYSLTFTLVALTGCSVGPNYKRPMVDTPTDWRWKEAKPRDAEAKGPWWELFHDADLSRLETEALAQNQNLKAAFARLDQVRAKARLSQGDFFPTLTGAPAWNRYRTSPNTATGVPFPIPSITANDFKVPLDLSYEIDLWGKVRRGFESARYEALASASDYQNILFSVQADVATHYYQLRSIDHEVQILTETIKLREETARIFQERYKTGYSSELDAAQSQTELATAKAELADAKRRRAESQNSLAILCGKPSSSFEVAPQLVSMSPPEVSPGIPSDLLERRPDVAEAERRLAARNADIGVAIAAFFPSVTLTASGGYESAQLKDLFDWESHVWSFGPSISIPIFSGGRNDANLQATRAAYEAAVADYRQQVLVAFQDVDNALAGLRFLNEQAQAQDEALQSARKSADLSIARYKNGVVDYLNVIDAERTRLANELSKVQIDTQRVITTIKLIKAIGGGWMEMPHSEESKKPNQTEATIGPELPRV